MGAEGGESVGEGGELWEVAWEAWGMVWKLTTGSVRDRGECVACWVPLAGAHSFGGAEVVLG